MMSCGKSETLPGGNAGETGNSESLISLLKDPGTNVASAKAIQPYVQKSANAKGSRFIMPFNTSGGCGVIQDLVIDTTGPQPVIVGGELGSFDTDLDGNDYYRENNDGTVSVHVTSNNACGEHFNFGTGEMHFGEKCNLSIKYEGPVVEICFPGPTGLICFTFIDRDAGKNANSLSGTGMVRLDGTGPDRKLSAKVINSQGGQNNVTMELK